jgi:hypothetical protein
MMRTINTSSGPVSVEADFGRPGHVVNTTAVVEENLTYVDESPEILTVLPAGDWCAVIEGVAVPMPVWVVLDDASMYGVVVGVDGCIDLTTGNVEELDGFTGYAQTKANEGVAK